VLAVPQGIAIAVILLNFILKKWITAGIWIIRPNSNSTRIAYTTVFMALCFYINTALIPVITGGDFSLLTELIFGNNSTIYYYIHQVGIKVAADINGLW